MGRDAFSSLGLNPQILDVIEEHGFELPTPIQEKAIPQVMSGQDLIGIAQTGTGKTGAYLWPILRRLNYAQGEQPRGLILVPTRELARQVGGEANKWMANLDLRLGVLYGGGKISTQRKSLEGGVDLLVATPGRLADLYKENAFNLKSVSVLVLDEADRMMDMGFMPQLKTLLEWLPMKRQNLLFSATFPPKVERLAEEFLDVPIRIEVSPQATPAETVEQSVYFLPNMKSKTNLLRHILLGNAYSRVLVFCKTRKNVDAVGKFIERKVEDSVRVVHANKEQNARINAIKAFSKGEIKYVVATDVSSRGLDIPEVDLVINFDLPIQLEEYVHRIGRTGRAGKEGEAISFANPVEKYKWPSLEKLIKQRVQVLSAPSGCIEEDTPFEEAQAMARELDAIKRKENPEFKGAFHEKKKRPSKNFKPKGKKKPRRKPRR